MKQKCKEKKMMKLQYLIFIRQRVTASDRQKTEYTCTKSTKW